MTGKHLKGQGTIVQHWLSLAQSLDLRNYEECSKFQEHVLQYKQTSRLPFFFVDHTKARLVYACERMPMFLPHLMEDTIGADYEKSSKRILPSHYPFVTQLSHRATFDYLYELSDDLRKETIFCKDFMVQMPDGQRKFLLQQGRVIDIDNKGGILLTMYKLIDVTHLKKGTHCNLIFTGPEQELVLYQYSSKEQKLSPKILISEKQKEVMALFDQMYTNSGIAMQLGITEDTVKSHRKNLLGNFGCKDMTGLKAYLGLLEV